MRKTYLATAAACGMALAWPIHAGQPMGGQQGYQPGQGYQQGDQGYQQGGQGYQQGGQQPGGAFQRGTQQQGGQAYQQGAQQQGGAFQRGGQQQAGQGYQQQGDPQRQAQTLGAARATAGESPAMQGRRAVVGQVIDSRVVALQNRQGQQVQHRLVKLKNREGKVVVVDLGVANRAPQPQQGETYVALGKQARINGRPVLLASYAGDVQPTGALMNRQQQQRQQQQQPQR